MSDKLDAKVMELLNVVRKQNEAIKKDEDALKTKWITNCSIELPSRNTPLNITTASEALLRSAMIELLTIEEMSAKADVVFGLPVSTKYKSFTFEDWKADMVRRMTMLKLKEKKEKLAEQEQRLNAVISPEQRRLIEIEEITSALGVKLDD